MKNEVLQSTAEEVSCHKTGNKDNALKVGLKITGVVEIKNKMLRWATVNSLLILRGGDIRLNLSSAFHDNELALFNTSLY